MIFKSSFWLPVVFVLLSILNSGCETPTKIFEADLNVENRTFSKIEYGKSVELKRSVIIDVRSQFDYQMSRVPRSFFAYWKDWDLSGYRGQALEDKKNELQRLLSLKGIDPLIQVVILGKGLSGQGEEFLMASTLMSLGVERISFMSGEQAKKALTTKGLPEIENVEKWSRPLKFNLNCTDSRNQKANFIIGDKKGSQSSGIYFKDLFKKDLKLKRYRFPKTMRPKLSSPNSHWAYGVALYLKEQGRFPCVL